MRSGKIAACFALVSFVAWAHPNLAQRLSFEEIDDAANYLRVVVDSPDATASDATCGLTSATASSLTQPLKAIFDAKLKSESARYPKSAPSPARLKNCAKECHCGVYVSLFEAVGEGKLTPAHRRALARLRSQAEKQTTDEVRACVAKKKICGAPLLTHIKGEAHLN